MKDNTVMYSNQNKPKVAISLYFPQTIHINKNRLFKYQTCPLTAWAFYHFFEPPPTPR